jgi:hypothetical protein
MPILAHFPFGIRFSVSRYLLYPVVVFQFCASLPIVCPAVIYALFVPLLESFRPLFPLTPSFGADGLSKKNENAQHDYHDRGSDIRPHTDSTDTLSFPQYMPPLHLNSTVTVLPAPKCLQSIANTTDTALSALSALRSNTNSTEPIHRPLRIQCLPIQHQLHRTDTPPFRIRPFPSPIQQSSAILRASVSTQLGPSQTFYLHDDYHDCIPDLLSARHTALPPLPFPSPIQPSSDILPLLFRPAGPRPN